MKTESLNGTWSRRVGCGEWTPVTVPYSTLPVGRSTSRRTFTPREDFTRLFLRFDGITYHAAVTLNGKLLGEMLPYCEYEFEITDLVTDGENLLEVELEDLNLSFGPTPGWENFGGIIRDVSLIYRDDNYITDVFFQSALKNDYRDATVRVDVETDKPSGSLTVELFAPDGAPVLTYTQASSETKEQNLSDISLWSPDTPTLYTLRVTLDDGDSSDRYECRVGFREFQCARHKFLLNGKPLFLKGLCKHEMIGDSGHVVSPEQIEEDLRMIKSTGSNFVRLVHYPHCKATLDIADRLGLMVSEEPGLWWSDTADEAVAGGSLEVLKRTILRDRNHPAIVFWLSFNECIFTEKFLVDSANLCRAYDPTRLVSGANCMSDEDTLIYYNKCGFDFYTMHPYSPTIDRAVRSAQMLHDKPLLFTEWGGYHVFDNPAYLRASIRKMAELYHADSDEGALAGALLWCWADMNDFNRGRPCIDGVLPEGIVTKDRQKHICYDAFCEEIAKIEDPQPGSLYEFRALTPFAGKALTPVTEGGSMDDLMATVSEEERALPFHSRHRQRKLKTPPVLAREEIAGISCIPTVLTDGTTLTYEGEYKTDRVTLLGAVSFHKGYPISGEFEEVAATVTVVYEGGEARFPIRNGRELTTVFASIASSRIDPRADLAPRFAEFSYDKNFELYLINRLTLPLGGEKKVTRVEITSANRGYTLLTYGCFAE